MVWLLYFMWCAYINLPSGLYIHVHMYIQCVHGCGWREEKLFFFYEEWFFEKKSLFIKSSASAQTNIANVELSDFYTGWPKSWKMWKSAMSKVPLFFEIRKTFLKKSCLELEDQLTFKILIFYLQKCIFTLT